MITEFKQNILDQKLFTRKDKLLVACSGGIDSMVLLSLLKESGFEFAVAHVNFQLRGHESQGDENFVRNYCERLKIPFFNISFDTKDFAAKKKISTQMAARELRYKWFETLLTENNFNFLLTAHHLDDSLETTLFNLIKGTGLNGLVGISQKRDYVRRPLLSFSKKVITDFAMERGIEWREDSSNSSDDYHRNFLRLNVIPLLNEINPSLLDTYNNTKSRLEGYQDLLFSQIDSWRSMFLKKKDDYRELDTVFLEGVNPKDIVLYELLRDFNINFTQSRNLASSLKRVGSFVHSEQYKFMVDRDRIIISKKDIEDQIDQSFLITDFKEVIDFDGMQITFEKKRLKEIERDPNVALLSLDKIKFPLILRRWRKGDFFQPLGMKGKKKVSDYLIDEKISSFEKEKIYVLESEGQICWILGHRIDDRFKIEDLSIPALRCVKSDNG